MLDVRGKRVALIGYGVSNKALCDYLIQEGATPVIRCAQPVDIPDCAVGVFGNDYLETKEEIVFLSHRNLR